MNREHIITTVILASTLTLGLALPGLAGTGKTSKEGQVDLPLCGDFRQAGDELDCNCPADFVAGSVWGSGPYTADSNICSAALHAGAISANGGNIRALARAGQPAYKGSGSNGVSSRDWGSYGRSFDVQPFQVVSEADLEICTTLPKDTDSLVCKCGPDTGAGSVWGSDPYTADSSICLAALHSGVLDGAGGYVEVLRIPGLETYSESLNNGVQSKSWGKYDSSIIFNWN